MNILHHRRRLLIFLPLSLSPPVLTSSSDFSSFQKRDIHMTMNGNEQCSLLQGYLTVLSVRYTLHQVIAQQTAIVLIKNNFCFLVLDQTDELLIMEQYLRQRIDCPPPGGTRTLIEEKDGIIKKQQDELNKLQAQLNTIQAERDYLLSILSTPQQSTISEHHQGQHQRQSSVFIFSSNPRLHAQIARDCRSFSSCLIKVNDVSVSLSSASSILS